MKAKHIPALDGVRGMAVLIVVAFHILGGAHSSNLLIRSLGTILKSGWTGVTLFFILSGFLITGILYDTRHRSRRLKDFYLRRTLRIAPLYYAAILLVLFSFFWAHEGRYGLSRIWILVLYLQNLPALGNTMNFFGAPLSVYHLWSLAVEEQFYLIWPVLILYANTLKRITTVCLIAFLASALYRIIVGFEAADPTVYSEFLFARAGELAIGGLLAMCYRQAKAWDRVQAYATYVMVASFIAFVAIAARWGLASGTSHGMAFLLPAATLFWASFVALSLSTGIIQRAMSVAWLRWFGGISYGLYVFHVLFAPQYALLAHALLPHAGSNISALLTAAITFFVSTGLAWLSFRYYEKPIQNLRSHFIKPQEAIVRQ